MKSKEDKSLFLAQGQLRKSEANQDILDAWNRANDYGDSGTPRLDDWEKAEIATKILFKIDSEGYYPYVTYNGTKYVFRDNLDLVDG